MQFPATNRRTRAYFSRLFRRSKQVVPIVTGFIGATADGQTTTIGRNGSDYSAAIVGAAVGASVIEIWTDVDGVLSADPRVVPAAFVLPQMTYEEAMELSYFGAKVLHSATIAPAVAKRIPILIKNTFNPDAPGTLISRKAVDDGKLAKGITSVGDLALLTLRGPGMVGVPGVAGRVFGTLASKGVNVVLISQASSEHTICFSVRSADAARAVEAIRQEFQFEFHAQSMQVDVRSDQAILAVVGEGMKGRPGVAGKVFDSLGRQNINISAIAQGASERNISCVIDASQQVRALNAIHQGFFETKKRLALAMIGVGNVGGAVLRQLEQQRPYLLSKGFDVTVVGLANSKRFLADPNGIDLAGWKDDLRAASNRMDAETFARRIGEMEITNVALVDCTSGPTIVDAYPAFIEANLHIITPNKWANALPWRRYEALMGMLERRKRHFLFEANVGAGLPVVSTLRDLIASGDEIVRIEGHPVGDAQLSVQHVRRQRAVQRARARRAPDGVHGARSARGSVRPGRCEKAVDSRAPDRPEDGSRRGEGGQPRPEAARARKVHEPFPVGVCTLRRRDGRPREARRGARRRPAVRRHARARQGPGGAEGISAQPPHRLGQG